MLSLIICSRQPDISLTLKENISDTIGTDYELVVVDNSDNKFSIFSAYNEGVRRAKYPYLCFMHEDILFQSKDWGKNVLEHLSISNTGIIGVAGSQYMPKMPGGHWSSGICSVNIIQSDGVKVVKHSYSYFNYIDSSINSVIIDGLWFCIPAELMRKVYFDEKTFKGFHCYDSDICMQIKKLNYDVKVIKDVLIEHFSNGCLDEEWLKNVFILCEKWGSFLPISSINTSSSSISHANYTNAKEVLELLKVYKFGIRYKLKLWQLYLISNPLINKRNWICFLVLIKKTCLPEPLKSLKILRSR